MERLMIFIDAEYVVAKVKDMRGLRQAVKRKDINWSNIINWITGQRKLVRCYYYSAEFSKEENPRTFQEQHEYLRALKLSIPYFEIKLGRLVRLNTGWMQKGLDVKIAIDMYAKAVNDQYDTAAIITGDSDFAEVVTEVKERFGKQVELYTFDHAIYDSLKLVPDTHIVINAALGRKCRFWGVPGPVEK